MKTSLRLTLLSALMISLPALADQNQPSQGCPELQGTYANCMVQGKPQDGNGGQQVTLSFSPKNLDAQGVVTYAWTSTQPDGSINPTVMRMSGLQPAQPAQKDANGNIDSGSVWEYCNDNSVIMQSNIQQNGADYLQSFQSFSLNAQNQLLFRTVISGAALPSGTKDITLVCNHQ